jgi:sterol desaturase/sphingolipid hydroxylase (fatty acid hydroxylase superfamily)
MRSTTRRITGSVILLSLALMLYAGLAVIDFSDSPMLFTVYWIVCSLLAFILFLLGLLDLREVREHRTVHQLKLLWRMTKDVSRKG